MLIGDALLADWRSRAKRGAARVRFLGRVDDDALIDVYRAADVSVVPSRAWEGFGLVTLESLACGTPVLVSDEGGLPEAVLRLDPDLVVPAGDVDALAAQLDRARRDPDRLPTREACRAYATRWTGDDATYAHRQGEVSPRIANHGLSPGDPIAGEMFPLVWPRSGVQAPRKTDREG